MNFTLIYYILYELRQQAVTRECHGSEEQGYRKSEIDNSLTYTDIPSYGAFGHPSYLSVLCILAVLVSVISAEPFHFRERKRSLFNDITASKRGEGYFSI